MRITGGTAGGRRLLAPRTEARPTQDRVREALFNIVGARIVGARFLDLFAGSGAVGIEAWSRGAKSVAWVESDRRALACLRENARALGVSAPAIVPVSVDRFLKKPQNFLAVSEFDIIFADPPYGKTEWRERLADGVRLGGALAPGGMWIMEAARASHETSLRGWRLDDARQYGATRLLFYRAAVADATEGA